MHGHAIEAPDRQQGRGDAGHVERVQRFHLKWANGKQWNYFIVLPNNEPHDTIDTKMY